MRLPNSASSNAATCTQPRVTLKNPKCTEAHLISPFLPLLILQMASTDHGIPEALASSLSRLELHQTQTQSSSSEDQPLGSAGHLAQPSDSSDGRAHAAPSARGEVGEIYGESAQQQRVPLPRVSTSSERHHREGYGFRPASGASTPLRSVSTASPLPDPNGLGWPGGLYVTQTRSHAVAHHHILFQRVATTRSAKSTVSRLNATPAETAAREKKMAAAVRTILECIGEDPDREGLQRTPDRYAQALMWMTRGYEERLKGKFHILILLQHRFWLPSPCFRLLNEEDCTEAAAL